jgi:hypothetical protein
MKNGGMPTGTTDERDFTCNSDADELKTRDIGKNKKSTDTKNSDSDD